MILASILIGLSLFLFPGPIQAAVADGVAVVVNGELITLSDLSREKSFLEMTGIAPVDEAMAEPGSDLLDQTILALLLRQRAASLGFVVADEEITAATRQMAANNNMSLDQIRDRLRADGVAWEMFADRIASRLLQTRLVDHEVASRIVISEQEIEEFYRRNSDRFFRPAEVRVRHILISLPQNAAPGQVADAESRLLALKTKVEAGEDFASLARLHSEDPSASNGGDLGYIRAGQLLPSFEEVAFALSPGQTSEPVRTPAGLHLIRVVDRQDEQVTSLDEVRDSLIGDLYKKKLSAGIKDFIFSLKKEAVIHSPPGGGNDLK